MNYTLDIIDTLNSNLVTKEESVGASSVILDYFGGDNKEELKIVPSSISFAMMGLTNQEGEYLHLFTSDETRYLGHLYDENNITIWKGYLLPDSYSEPYAAGAILIDFEAVDGLARLKGKYLPADFYSEEKSVIQIISECLKLTGLTLDFRISPAIENAVEKDYNQIFIDTSLYLDKGKQDNAYKILEDLMNDMLCVVYQQDGYWNIEGLNIREQQVYNTFVYNSEGVYLEEQQVTRNLQELDALGVPQVTMRPPFGKISVIHEKEPSGLPDTLTKINEDKWASYSASMDKNDIIFEDWYGNQDNFVYTNEGKANIPRVKLGQPIVPIYFRHNRPYVKKGQRYRLTMEFSLNQVQDLDKSDIAAIREAGYWTNPFDILVWLGEVSMPLPENVFIASGTNGFPEAVRFSVSFDKDGDFKQTLEFVPNRSGELTFWIYTFGGLLTEADDNIESIEISNLELTHVGFKEEEIAVIESSEEYTTEYELELETADDAGARSRAFRLAKLNTLNTYEPYYLDIIRQFPFKGEWYAVAPLKLAHLVENNPEVYNGGNQINVLEVIYNFFGSQEHALRLDAQLYNAVGEAPQLEVRVYNYNYVSGDRSTWEQWTDSINGIEADKYTTSACKILSRCTSSPIPTIQDITCLNNIKFGDIASFPYNNRDKWIITSLSWNLDEGESTLGLSQAYYTAFLGEQTPPIARIYSDNMQGEIAFFENTDTFTLLSDAYSPGFIVSYEWQILEGTGTITAPTQETAVITGATSDYYRVQLTVTDNEGVTAIEEIEVYNFQSVQVSFTQQAAPNDDTYIMAFTPDMKGDQALNIQGYLLIEGNFLSDSDYVEIIHNDFVVGRLNATDLDRTIAPGYYHGKQVIQFSITYITGDIIKVKVYQQEANQYCYADFTRAYFTVGYGTVTGVPVKIGYTAE